MSMVEFTQKQFGEAMARRQWCAMLAKLVSPSFPVDATKALLDMLPMMLDLPDYLFTPETMKHVARQGRRQAVPAFDEIMAALTGFRRIYLTEPREPSSAYIPEGRPPPDDIEKANVRSVVSGLLAELAARHIAQPPQPPLPDVTLKGEALAKSRAARGLVAASVTSETAE